MNYLPPIPLSLKGFRDIIEKNEKGTKYGSNQMYKREKKY